MEWSQKNFVASSHILNVFFAKKTDSDWSTLASGRLFIKFRSIMGVPTLHSVSSPRYQRETECSNALAMIYLSAHCQILPLTGLNVFVHTGLSVQKLFTSGWVVGRITFLLRKLGNIADEEWLGNERRKYNVSKVFTSNSVKS